MNSVKKAVIPVAGFGTRMLPLSKSVPKEMLPVNGLPVIHHVVAEAVSAGCNQILFITRPGKESILEYFRPDNALEKKLAQKGQLYLLDPLIALRNAFEFESIEQKAQNGLGDAISYARKFVGKDDFAILLGDAILHSNSTPILKQMMDFHEQQKASIVAVEEIPENKISRYGIVGGTEIEKNLWQLNQLMEKPDLSAAPSNLAIAARYILPASIFDLLENTKKGTGGEVQITDALHQLAQREKMLAFKFEGKRLDIGNPEDFLQANIYLSQQK